MTWGRLYFSVKKKDEVRKEGKRREHAFPFFKK